MRFDEHTSKVLLEQIGIPVPPGLLAPERGPITAPFPLPWVLKAQVLTGGRGKAGGIRIVQSREEAEAARGAILERTIGGKRPTAIRVEPCLKVEREMYLSFTVHRASARLVATAGRHGGIEVESAPKDSLRVEPFSAALGLEEYHIRNLFFHLDLPMALLRPFAELVRALARLFLEERLLVLEINPLAVTAEGSLVALDAKIEADDHRVAQSPRLAALVDPRHDDPVEVRARQAGLSFHKLQGRVGMMVNGAGLAMATMDLLHAHGMPAANFLDLGGGADAAAMRQALDLLLEDPQVEAVCINIFGGILSCADVAGALLRAVSEAPPVKPVVVRLSGNRAEEGLRLLSAAQLSNVHPVETLDAAMEKLHALTGVRAPAHDHGSLPPAPMRRTPPVSPAPFPLGAGTRVLVQGITGKQGQLHTRLMQEYGTQVVAGVTPGKGGTSVLGVPVYHTVEAACARHAIDASILFVPAPLAPDAMLEAAACGIPWIVCITDGIPQQDMLRVLEKTRSMGCRIIGPNCPGLIVPGGTKIGIMPAAIFRPGPIAVLSRSGTLTYETVARLSAAGFGQKVCIGVGGDPFVGSSFTDLAPLVVADPDVQALVVLGEIGGRAEEDLGAFLQEAGIGIPLVGFIAGRTAPRGKRLGHAGAILEDTDPGVEAKITRMHEKGYAMAPTLDHIPQLVARLLAAS